MKRFYYIILLGLVVSILFSVLWSYKEQKDSKKDIEEQINKVFNSQDEISDGDCNVVYSDIKILNHKIDKKLIDKIPLKFSNSLPIGERTMKDAKIIAHPFLGFEYVKLSKNNSSTEKDEFNNTEYYTMDSIVSSYIVYYGEDVDKFKHLKEGEISEIFEDITKKCYDAIVQKNSISDTRGKLGNIQNFPRINNKYYSLEFGRVINHTKDGKIFGEWYEIGDYNLYIVRSSGSYKIKENNEAIFYEKLKYLGIFLLIYFMLSLILFLIIKIIKK